MDVIPGDDDGLLSVETMKLVGAADFMQTERHPPTHAANYEEVRAATLNFLQNGYFTSADARRPIVAAAAAASP